MPFNFRRLDIPDIILVEPKSFGDGRGFFTEIYKSQDFKKAGINNGLLQVNYSKSKKNVLRGLHYQMDAFAQAKLIWVILGQIYDVAVDIRKGSPYYGKWTAVTLSQQDMNMLYIPEGFAHGFCVLSEEAGVVYCCSNIYSAEHDRGIAWDDPALGIIWPVKKPLVSEKDLNLPLLSKADNDFVYSLPYFLRK